MDITVFIGHHKVGSSSLQRFLASNWLRLVRHGILYPAVESQGLAFNLARAVADADAPLLGPLNVREPHNALAFRMLSELSEAHVVPPWHPDLPGSEEMFLALLRQVRQLRPRGLALCSEVMANFGASAPQAIDRLREGLPEGRVRLLVTLRRPDAYLVSWHNQRLKFGHRVGALRRHGLRPYWGGVHFDYRLMLGDWLDRFPGAEISVRRYEEVRAAGGSIPDFLDRAGFDFPEGLMEVSDANPSLPLAVMEIARRGNVELPGEEAAALRRWLMEAGRRLPLTPDAQVEMFGPEVRARLVENFAPVNAWLSRRVGPDPFFPDMAEAARLRPVPELEAAEAALALLRAELAAPAPVPAAAPAPRAAAPSGTQPVAVAAPPAPEGPGTEEDEGPAPPPEAARRFLEGLRLD